MFPIGEFSKIARVSKRLLHHYDEIGLLKPARIDPHTGYRFYSAKQLPQLNRILSLKELGFSLDRVAKMLHAQLSDEEIRGMLLLKKAELEQALLDDLQRLRRIEARLAQNQRPDDAPDIVVRPIPAQPFLATRAIFPSPDELLQLVRQVQRVVPAQVDRRVLGPLVGIVYTNGFTLRNNDVEIGYLLDRPIGVPIPLTDGRALRVRELPAVPAMATTVQAGGPELVFVALGRIGQWIEANGYRIAGPYREVGIALPGPGAADDLVIEVQMPIEKPRASSGLLHTRRDAIDAPSARAERITSCSSA